MIRLATTFAALTLMACATAGGASREPVFPVQAELFIDGFRGSEGITFNGEGRLFIGANNAAWLAEPNGAVKKLVDVHRHLGQAGIGERDILAADFGPTNAFQGSSEDDGIVWRITPEGERTTFATGIADPNAIIRLPGGTWLVSDDATDKIYKLVNGRAEVWTTSVPFPNGMALSRDGKTLYVAQSFSAIGPVVPDNALWTIAIGDDKPGEAKIVARTKQAPDGLTADEKGRIYIADNGSDSVLRFDPETGEVIVIAEGLTAVASLVFGEGAFDRYSLYATSTMRGGGKVWRIPVGVKGAKLLR